MWEYLSNKINPRRGPKADSDVKQPHPVDRSKADQPVNAHPDRTEENPTEQNRLRPLPRSSARRHRTHLQCPVCDETMHIEIIGNVEIDRCPVCGGMFLDRGELGELRGSEPSSYAPGNEQSADSGTLIYTPHGLSDHVRDTGD